MNSRPIWLAALLFLTGCPPSGLGEPNPDFLVIGHRGAPRIEAENTIPAFQKAMDLGANSIETDLCITADDYIVVWHDRDPDDAIAVARQTGVEGLAYIPAVPPLGDSMRRPVDQLTLDELRATHGYAHLLDARDTSKLIPTLEELMAWAADEPRLKDLYLDIKLAPEQGERAAWLFNQAIDLRTATTGGADLGLRFICPEKTIATALEAARIERSPENVSVSWDVEQPGVLEGMRSLSLKDASMGITPSWTWTKFTVEVSEVVEAREDGEIDSVTVWTIDRSKDMSLMLYHGVDGMMTNDPAELYKLWQQTLSDE